MLSFFFKLSSIRIHEKPHPKKRVREILGGLYEKGRDREKEKAIISKRRRNHSNTRKEDYFFLTQKQARKTSDIMLSTTPHSESHLRESNYSLGGQTFLNASVFMCVVQDGVLKM